MKIYRLSSAFLLLLLALPLAAQQSGKMSTALSERVQSASADTYLPVGILLSEQFDVLALHEQLNAEQVSLAERSRRVITALQEVAERQQPALLQELRQMPSIRPNSIRPFWINNSIFVEIQVSGIQQLIENESVGQLIMESPIRLSKTEAEAQSTSLSGNVEIGLQAIKAPALWAMGYTGYMRTAYIIDTGTDPDHVALDENFKGNFVPLQQAWFDPLGMNNSPYDCQSHGTHVTGTILGLDRQTADTIGVAPNGLWMASPPVACPADSLRGTSNLVACFQWALDPDSNATTADMPDAINNSWYDGQMNQDPAGTDCASAYVPVFNALEAAGVAVIFSAGNAGPGTATITPPHNINTNIVNSFTIGALDGADPQYNIASFSSRGPSHCGGTGSILIKPEVSAPGVAVRSCVPGNGYAQFSGTSMAAPHVTGAILLLREAFPNATGEELKLALYYTAVDLGVAGEDNTYGMGIIDVEAAYYYLINQGKTPAIIDYQHDVALIGIELARGNDRAISCSDTLRPFIRVRNAGSQPLTSLDIAYDYSDGLSGNINWTGTIAPQSDTLLPLPDRILPQGFYRLDIALSNPNGQNDQQVLDNSWGSDFTITYPDFPNLQGDEAVCTQGEALLFIENATNVSWYDEVQGGNLMAQANPFLTPQLTQGALYYARPSFVEQVGPSASDAANGYFDNSGQKELQFDAFTNLRISSIRMNTQSNLIGNIQLVNAEGDIIASELLTIFGAGIITIDLDFRVPAGEDYRLRFSSGNAPPLLVQNINLSLPYGIPGIMNIDTLGGEIPYFFDLEVNYDYPCRPLAAVVPVQTGTTEALFNAPNSVEVGATASFTDQSNNATSWAWYFSDGSSSNLQNPSMMYTELGWQSVYLRATGPICSDARMDSLQVVAAPTQVNTIEVTGLRLYPNPNTGQFTVEYGSWSNMEVGLRLHDVLGRTVWQRASQTVGTQEQLRLPDLEAGVYYLQLRRANGMQQVLPVWLR